MGILTLEYLQHAWETFVHLDKFKPILPGLEAGLKNLKKWYNKTDNSPAYFIVMGTCSL